MEKLTVEGAILQLTQLYKPMSIVEEAFLLKLVMIDKNLSMNAVAKLVSTTTTHVHKTLKVLEFGKEYRDLADKHHLKSNRVYNDWMMIKRGTETEDDLISAIKQDHESERSNQEKNS